MQWIFKLINEKSHLFLILTLKLQKQVIFFTNLYFNFKLQKSVIFQTYLNFNFKTSEISNISELP